MMGLLNALLGMSFAMPVVSVAAHVLIGALSCRGMTWVLSPFGISDELRLTCQCLSASHACYVHRHMV
jgi:hypothetical protein